MRGTGGRVHDHSTENLPCHFYLEPSETVMEFKAILY